MTKNAMRVRRARANDVAAIHQLIAIYSPDGTLLPRSLDDIRAHRGEFIVAEAEGRLLGCGGLYRYPNGLLEIRSIAVAPDCQHRGVGTHLVRRLLQEAQRSNAKKIFLFTRIPDFFARWGFFVVSATSLPEKIWKDCRLCPRLTCCDEIPMVFGVAAAAHILPSRPDVPALRVLPG